MDVSEAKPAQAKSLIAVSPMSDGDADGVSQLFAGVLAELPYYNEKAKRSEGAKYTAERLREAIRSRPDAVLVARSEGEIVGFCFSNEDDGVIWLSWFGVHPTARLHGAGTTILRALEDRAISSGFRKIWCDCRTTNTGSKVTLTSFGFEPLCTIRNHWYGQDFILWEKLLASPAT